MYTILSTTNCSKCMTAKNIAEAYGLDYEVQTVGVDLSVDEFLERTNGARAFPQIFKDGTLIGTLEDFQKAI